MSNQKKRALRTAIGDRLRAVRAEKYGTADLREFAAGMPQCRL